MDKKKILWILGIILVVFIFERIFSSTVFAEKLELKSYDLRTKISTSLGHYKKEVPFSKKKIVIVAVDDYSKDELLKNENIDLGPWPWPRDTWSNVVNFIEKGEPKAILFDLVFDKMDTNHWNDRRLAQVLGKYDNIVLGTYLYKHTLPEDVSDKNDFAPTYSPLNVTIDNKRLDKAITFYSNSPVPDIYTKFNTMAAANRVTDVDFVTRKTRPVYKLVKDGKTYYMPSLAFAGLMQYLGDKDKVVIKNSKILYKGRTIPLNNDGLVNISWNGFGQNYSYVPVSKILLSQKNQKIIKSDFFKNKIVIIGRVAKDIDVKPLSTSYEAFEANAAALDNFINDTDKTNPNARKFISKMPIAVEYLLIIFSCALVCFFGLMSKTSVVGAINNFIAIILYILFCIWIFASPQSRLWIPMIVPLYYLIVTAGIVFAYKFHKEFAKRATIREVFEKLVSPKMLSILLKTPENISLKSTKKCVTIMSCNINNFASLAQKHNSENFISDLNNLFEEIVNIIFENNGTVDSITQGCISAYWGEPVSCENDAYLAVKSALEIKKKVNDLRILNTKENKMVFDITTGINTGEAILGLAGGQKLKNYTIMGDSVELAAKLEQSCITLKRDILITKSTYQEAQEKIIALEVGKLSIKGYDRQVEVFEPIDIKSQDK